MLCAGGSSECHRSSASLRLVWPSLSRLSVYKIGIMLKRICFDQTLMYHTVSIDAYVYGHTVSHLIVEVTPQSSRKPPRERRYLRLQSLHKTDTSCCCCPCFCYCCRCCCCCRRCRHEILLSTITLAWSRGKSDTWSQTQKRKRRKIKKEQKKSVAHSVCTSFIQKQKKI